MKEQMTSTGILVLGLGIVGFWIVIAAAVRIHAGRLRAEQAGSREAA